MAALTGVLWIEERDLATDFAFSVSSINGFPGILSSAPRDVPVSEAPELSGGIVDHRLIRRKRVSPPEISGIIMAASQSAAMTALDGLRNLVSNGEVRIRTTYASDRWVYAMCESFAGAPFNKSVIDGYIAVQLLFTVAEGAAVRVAPDGIALSTTRVACPIGTAASYPVILIHGGGAVFTNPTITVRNAGGDIVQTMSMVFSGGANDVLRVDCARAQVDKISAGVVTDGLSYATLSGSSDFPILRPYDGWVETATYPTVELSSVTGTVSGRITYSRRYL